MSQIHRTLTYDEKKAAEAAFKGSPFDPQWSEAAQNVYVGLSLAMAHKQSDVFQDVRPSQATTIAMEVLPESQQESRMICREQN